MGKSETSKCRERLEKYCVGNGLDIGYGGDPITPSSITLDLPSPLSKRGDWPQNLRGDGRDLYWFRDSVLDYVYSSHVLEEFENTGEVLKEWLRVIKPGGFLVLYCPDEQVYREWCKLSGQSYNKRHKIENFSLEYVKSVIAKLGISCEVVYERAHVDKYSFELVVRKL